jgi:two-component system sensor histidine kinase KdpD
MVSIWIVYAFLTSGSVSSLHPKGLSTLKLLRLSKGLVHVRRASPLEYRSAIWQVLTSCSSLALITASGFQLRVSLTTISFADLILIFCVALFFGFWQASVVSVLATASLDYFFAPPLFQFTISDPQDWVSLATFEFTALLISRLSAKEHHSSLEARLHRAAMEQLYELSRNSLLLDLRQPPGVQLVVLIHRIFKLDAVALFDANLARQDVSGDWCEEQSNLASECYFSGNSIDDLSTHTAARALKGSSGPVGGLALRGQISPIVIEALAMLAALAVDRYQSFEKEERAETARKSEQLRAAVMDSLAHEFKTPLSTVHTATSGLIEFGGVSAYQAELLSIIDQQTARMISLCTKLLLTAKLESGRLPIASAELNVQTLTEELLAEISQEEERQRIQLSIEDPTLTVHADRGLLAMILAQYLDNARKYSTPGTPIEIAVRKSFSEVLFSVHNVGANIPLDDRERIFDRFYRSKDHVGSIPGTGIGLSVVKKAANAHKGHVWVVSDEIEGTTFFLSIPQDGGRV